MVLQYTYDAAAMPADALTAVIKAFYESNRFSYFARVISKYHKYLPTSTVQSCFEILAKVVATPMNATVTPEIIYHSALGLKTLMSEMEAENVPLEVLAACIANIVGLVRIRDINVAPTLLWPIINLLIRLVKCLNDISKDAVSEAVCIIIQGISAIISSDKNEELIVCATA